jgi:dihydroneopterin aldolase
MDRIILKGMEFYAFHGATPAERAHGQHFRLDVEMQVDLLDAGKTDQLTETVHYGHVFKRIRDTVTGTAWNLIETVAQQVADTILAEFPKVRSVTVRVEKPKVPIQGSLDYAAVEITRSQSHA